VDSYVQGLGDHMVKKDVKISKGKKITNSAGSMEVGDGETLIREAHWSNLTAKKAEKDLIKILKAEDKRTRKQKVATK